MAGTLKFNVRLMIDGKEQVVQASASVKELARNIAQAREQSKGMLGKMLEANNAILAFGAVNHSLQQLVGEVREYSAANAVQVEAETKLATVMRQRMGATDAEIDSIKSLASAQQVLGVIGDEVQLMGAQQLATFLDEKGSIDALLPAMNNLLAQQRGLTATEQDAVSVGNLMGKAMQGQTSALTRVGITFTEAQAEVMKFGTEAERAAMLAQIITDNVGEMNAELAKTDAGKAKQAANDMGDLKEQVGALVAPYEKVIAIAGSVGMAITGFGAMAAAVKSAASALGVFTLASKGSAAVMKLIGMEGQSAGKAMKLLGHAIMGVGRSAKASAIAVKGLRLALAAGGIGAAIAIIATAFGAMSGAADDAAEKAERLKEVEDTYASEAARVKTEIDQEAAALGELIKAHGDTSATIRTLNEKYGEIFGRHAKAAEWYDILTKKSAAYAKMVGYEAQQRMLASRIAEKELQLELNREKQQGLIKEGKATRKMVSIGSSATGVYQTKEIETYTAEFVALRKEGKTLNDDIADLNRQLDKANEKIGALREGLGSEIPSGGKTGAGGKTPTPKAEKTEPVFNPDAKTLAEVKGNIAAIQKRKEGATIETIAALNKEESAWRGVLEEMENAGKATEATDEAGTKFNAQARTLAECENNARYYAEALQSATTVEEAAAINSKKQMWDDKAEAMRNAGKAAEDTSVKFNPLARTLAECENNARYYEEQLSGATIETAPGIKKSIELWQRNAEAIRNAGDAGKEAFGKLAEGWGAIKGISGGIENISEALNGNGSAWERVCAGIDGFIAIVQGFQAVLGVISFFNTLVHGTQIAQQAAGVAAAGNAAATGGMTAAQVAETAAAVPAIAANKALTASYAELAAAKYFAAHASVPFVGFGIAAGFATSATVITQAIGATPFAEGGVVSGPTLGLIGEYSGARNNPEVVAPLDRLRQLIEPAGEQLMGKVTFEIEGRKLVGVIEREYNRRRRV